MFGGDGVIMIHAEGVILHPEFTTKSTEADIALITLSQKVQFSDYVRPVCMWLDSDNIDDIIGNGTVVSWSEATTKPREIPMPVVSQLTCLRSTEAFVYITSARTFCAGT